MKYCSKRVVSSSEEDEAAIVHRVNREEGEMPQDAKSTDDEAGDVVGFCWWCCCLLSSGPNVTFGEVIR